MKGVRVGLNLCSKTVSWVDVPFAYSCTATGRKHFFPGNCSPSSRGRKQYLPGNCSPSSQRKQFSLGNCSPSLWGRRQFSAGNCSTSSWGSKQSPQATAHLPSGEAGSSSQATAYLPPGEGNSSSQSTTLPSPGEGSGNSQAGNQAMSGKQGFMHSTRHMVAQASQGNSTASQADSTNPLEGNTNPTIPSRLSQGSSNEEPNPKWVINLSSKPLTPAQRSVPAKGPNFVVSPRQPPNLEYITAIEAASTKLSQQDAEELRADINIVLRSSHPPKPTLTKAQNLALRELKRDRDCIVLTADKGVAMVIMDRQDYIKKANHLLNQNTYRSITKDPNNSIKNKLINILKRVKNQTGLDSNTYKSMYPTGCVPPKFYGLPKIHKPDTPLRPIVSSCGSVTYGVAKELAEILKPLVGKSPHHITSTQDFMEQGKQIKLEPGECLSSYDVSALFTSVPIDPALTIIKDLLDKGTTP